MGGTQQNIGQQQTQKIIEDNQLRIKVKPHYNLTYKLITTIFQFLVILIFIEIFIMNIVYLWEIWPFSRFLTVLAGILYTVVKMTLGKFQYDNMEYNFYATKVEYKDGFLNKEEKELKYQYIREVSLRQNVLERALNLGTIRLNTNATTGVYNSSNRHNNAGQLNGVHIHCVENVKDQYKAIKQIIDEGTPND